MRRTLFWAGWVILFALPIAFGLEVVIEQDLPNVQPWQWAILAAAVLLIYFSRNRDDVFKYHVA
jgi:lipid-A-disaccharide synthase-like uncharacterized protein